MPRGLGRSLCLSYGLQCTRFSFHTFDRTGFEQRGATIEFHAGKQYFSRFAYVNRDTAPRKHARPKEKTAADKQEGENKASQAKSLAGNKGREYQEIKKETDAKPIEGLSTNTSTELRSSLEIPCDPAAPWIEALEPFLPPHLRSSSPTTAGSNLNAEETCTGIMNLLAKARESKAGIDVLATLGVRDGRWSTILTVVETLIADAAARIPNPSFAQLPSNLQWPTSTTLDNMTTGPIEIDQRSYSNRLSSMHWDELSFDPRYDNQMRVEKYKVVEQIWMSLGSIILELTDLPSEKSSEVMMYVHRIIARLHNSGFIPDHVYSYSYSISSDDSAARRPPLMHLLSSRILTTLSDAVLRGNQDELNARAATAGVKYRGLIQSLPGAQSRSKVRELGPEIWLEFVLWCCVDGGFASAGSWIVERMRKCNTDLPWSAVHLTSASDDETFNAALVDWASVNQRPSSMLGRIKSDCDEKAPQENQNRTISAEVVLALIEASIDSRSPGVAGRGNSQESVLTWIEKLLMFLEPHSLPQKYLDYLTVRLFQPLLYDFEKDTQALQALSETLRLIRSLESTSNRAVYLPSLKVDSILEQSEVYAGVLHQLLESFAVAGRAGPTVDVFNQIQELTDQSKLRSIGSFLQSTRRRDQSLFPDEDSVLNQEYTLSHGQLPAQKLATFLALVTDAGLTDLGQWLLYSMDVDGPLIPLGLYSKTSMNPSVQRFAAATEDHILLEDVADAVRNRPGKPPVSYLRSYADAQLRLKNFESAGQVLACLNEAKGGGSSLSNMSNALAAITRLEKSAEHYNPGRSSRLLSPGLSLLDWLLQGDFRGSVRDYRKDQIKDQLRGLACLLRVAEAIPGSILSDFAKSWIPKLAQSNVVGLKARVFDILLVSVVETRGARVGMMLWDLFCEEPGHGDENIQKRVPPADTKLDSTADGLELPPDESPLPGHGLWPRDVSTRTKVGVDLRGNGIGEGAVFAAGHVEEKAIDDGDTDFMNCHAVTNEYGPGLLESSAPMISPAFGGLAAQAQPLAVSEEDPIPEVDLPTADISIPSIELSHWISEDSVPVESADDDVLPLAPQAPGQSRRIPVVKPTFRTLRIIIRAAVEELEAAEKVVYVGKRVERPEDTSEFPAKINMRALETAIINIELAERWAKPLLHRFGLSGEDIAVEFGRKLDEKGNIFSTKELQKRYLAAKEEYELAKQGIAAQMSKVNIRKNFKAPPIRKVGSDVKEISPRELAFYYYGLKESGSSS